MAPSRLPGGRGFLAQLYRAFRGVLTPNEVDRHSPTQLAILMGLDETGGLGGAPSIYERPPAPPSADGAEPPRRNRVRVVR